MILVLQYTHVEKLTYKKKVVAQKQQLENNSCPEIVRVLQ